MVAIIVQPIVKVGYDVFKVTFYSKQSYEQLLKLLLFVISMLIYFCHSILKVAYKQINGFSNESWYVVFFTTIKKSNGGVYPLVAEARTKNEPRLASLVVT